MRLYRRLQFGNLIDLSILDTRQWRSDQACGDGIRNNCAEALDQKRTIMGLEQEKWLFDNLASAKARWTVIGQQVPTFARDLAKVSPEGRFAMDKWDGYTRPQRYTSGVRNKGAESSCFRACMHYRPISSRFPDPRSPVIGSSARI